MQQLQNENEQLKAQITGLAFNLRVADEKNKQYEMQLDQLHKLNLELSNEINQLKIHIQTNNRNQNDSRYY